MLVDGSDDESPGEECPRHGLTRHAKADDQGMSPVDRKRFLVLHQ
jgi:hypothetical protein